MLHNGDINMINNTILHCIKNQDFTPCSKECNGCSEGINMCMHEPCVLTPSEARALIDAGFQDKLTIDWVDNAAGAPVYYYLLCGAVGWVKQMRTDDTQKTRCTFLGADNRCELHELGLKPTEGKVACCKYNDFEAKFIGIATRDNMLPSWDTEENQKLILNISLDWGLHE